MMEIFAIPYFAVSGVIGWVIFGPFFRILESESLSRANITVSDLLAVALPVGVLFGAARWVMPESFQSITVQVIVIAIAFAFAATALAAGLFLVPKGIPITFVKRIAVVGIIAPFGILLTIGWVGFLTWACVYSMLYLAPTTIVLAAAISGLRILGSWVCQDEASLPERTRASELTA
ncbi:MAG: hypothetical protein AAF664_05215 [Planctomycetota bacterium]